MQNSEETRSYAELTSDAYELVVDAATAANHRAIDYARAFWDIVSRPDTSAPDALVSLTFDAMQTSNAARADFARKSGRIAFNLSETYLAVLQGIAQTSISNLAFARDAVSQPAAHELPSLSFN